VLRRGAPAPPRHGDLARALDVGRGGDVPPVAEVRRAVLAVRAAKSMLLVPDDENRRSAGSFFVNPVVPNDRADAVETAARRHGTTRPMPRYPAGPGELKLSAAWLIEQAGIPRGFRLGRAGVSTRHTLALVNRGGATAAEIVALAACVRAAVRERFGVVLQPEPVFLGFGRDEAELLG